MFMQWDSSYNQPLAFIILLAIMPFLKRGHKAAHEESKKRMKEGWLKWLVTHEFGKRRTSVADHVRAITKRPE